MISLAAQGYSHNSNSIRIFHANAILKGCQEIKQNHTGKLHHFQVGMFDWEWRVRVEMLEVIKERSYITQSS